MNIAWYILHKLCNIVQVYIISHKVNDRCLSNKIMLNPIHTIICSCVYLYKYIHISLKKKYYVELLNKLVVMDSIDKQVFKA